MPAKNTIGKYHKRYKLLSKAMWRRYRKETKDKISWHDFTSIIKASMTETKAWVLREPIGFQFPNKIGNLTINKFKTYGDFKSYSNIRNKDGKALLNHNLHTGGYCFRIQMFLCSRVYRDRRMYWFFDAERKFDRQLAEVLKAETYPAYNCFVQDHFIKRVIR